MSPAAGEPGNAELMRAIETLRVEFREMRVDLAKDYVRKEVQDAREQTANVQFKGIEDEMHSLGKQIAGIIERQTATWRLALAGIIYPLIVGVILYLVLGSANH